MLVVVMSVQTGPDPRTHRCSGLEAGGDRVDPTGGLFGQSLRVEDLDDVDGRELLESRHDLVGDREGRPTTRAAPREAHPRDAVADRQVRETARIAVDEAEPGRLIE